jgi:hypothetical protein
VAWSSVGHCGDFTSLIVSPVTISFKAKVSSASITAAWFVVGVHGITSPSDGCYTIPQGLLVCPKYTKH